MNVWIAKAVMLAASVALVVIRAPHGHRSHRVKIAKNNKSTQEIVLLTIMWISFFIPLVWIVSPAFSFAEYPLRAGPLIAGVVCYVVGLWLFHRSHADLGTNWSITLQLREEHQLITHGVYRRVRHPMYTALLLYSIGQALVIPNWLVGPSYLVAMIILLALHLPGEGRMMLDQFGDEYVAYSARSKRFVPGVW